MAKIKIRIYFGQRAKKGLFKGKNHLKVALEVLCNFMLNCGILCIKWTAQIEGKGGGKRRKGKGEKTVHPSLAM